MWTVDQDQGVDKSELFGSSLAGWAVGVCDRMVFRSFGVSGINLLLGGAKKLHAIYQVAYPVVNINVTVKETIGNLFSKNFSWGRC